MKLSMHCPSCGSPAILRDAFAEWDVEEQEWLLSATFDNFTCDNCGKDCNNPEERPIDDGNLGGEPSPSET
jgi:predicted RNA-binding Zn-ribbon protein involved in translation (DUF1610 family)